MRTLAQPAPQPGGRLLERICPVEPLFIVPRSLAGGCPTHPGSRNVTERCSLSPPSHGKAPSGSPPYPLRPDVSRKDALWRGACRSHRLLSLTLMERQYQDTDILNLRHSLDARKGTPHLSRIVEIVEFHIIRGAAEPVACWRGVAAGSYIRPSHRRLLASVPCSLCPLAPR